MKNILMTLVIILVFFIIYAAPCLAKDMYVGDITKLNIRSGKGVESDVVATLKPGQKVTILTFASGWTKIRSEDGKQGWVVSRYLTNQKPAAIEVDDLKIEMESMQEKIEILTIENERLKTENIDLSTRLDENVSKLDNTQQSFNALKTGSKDFLSIKNKYDQLSKDIKAKDIKINTLEEQLDDRYLSMAIKWFLAGAAVLMVGFLLGAGSKRKRSSYL